jgi:poly-beta-1,6-N-acetyl-D-glucosamine synthase
LIPLRIIRRGYRVTFEAAAVAYDGYAASIADEFRRKVRTLAGNFQLFVRERWLLDPRQNPLWIQTFSHKALRLLIPVLLAGAAISNVFLLTEALFRLTLVTQAAFYLAALTAAIAPGLRRRVRGLIVPYTICLLSWATLVAFVQFLQRRQSSVWERAAINEPG